MVMRDEDVTERRQWYARGGELSGHAITTVHDVRGAIDQDDL
jgi:hypothetical protein